jgi:hypothetical protein
MQVVTTQQRTTWWFTHSAGCENEFMLCHPRIPYLPRILRSPTLSLVDAIQRCMCKDTVCLVESHDVSFGDSTFPEQLSMDWTCL